MIKGIVASSSSSTSRVSNGSWIEWIAGSTYDATVVDVFPDYAWLVVEALDRGGRVVKKRAMLDKTHVSFEPANHNLPMVVESVWTRYLTDGIAGRSHIVLSREISDARSRNRPDAMHISRV